VPRGRTALFLACGAWLGLRAWAALRPTAFPYLARPVLDLPRPLITRGGLLKILEPAPGERILEVGPGTGYYTLPVAARLRPGGVLEVLEVRQSYLDHTLERARKAGLANVLPRLGDGAHLPYPSGRFDAAYLVTVLGEIPDPQAALRELRRVLKSGGRLVVGEIFIDPDFPRLAWLVRRARAAGLMLDRRIGTPVAYFARFRAEPNAER
jgi:ubiquinone/menaquinone biosynthesis C-methylase UbiE